MKLINLNKLLKAQTVVEILITTAIVSILLVGLLQLGTYSTKTSKYSENVNKATEYSSQVIEWLKAQKNTLGWQVFMETMNIGTTKTFCINNIPTTLNELASNDNSCTSHGLDNNTFKREVTITSINHGGILDEYSITATTYWGDNDKYKAEMKAKITKWR